jgi:hypothetical protein
MTDGGNPADEVSTRFLQTTCLSTSGVLGSENRSGIRASIWGAMDSQSAAIDMR